MAKVAKVSLVDVLLREKFITEEDLEKVKEYQKKNGASFANAVVKLGLVTEEQVVIGLAEQLGIPHVKLSNYQLDPEVMDLLPEKVIRENKVVPLSRSGNTLTVAMANPTLSEIEQAIADYYSAGMVKDLEKLIEKSTGDDGQLRTFQNEAQVDLTEAIREAEEAPIIRMVNLILSRAIRERASDVHIEPFEKKLQVRFRIDGVLYPITSFPKRVQNAVISRIKILSDLDIAEHRLPQDGRFRIKAYNRDVDFRVSKVVLRLLDKAQLMGLTIDKLGLEENVLEKFKRAIQQPYGMIVLTGPTSCGKSTSLYEKNILTIEDPVEYEMEGVNQVQVHEEIGLTFSRALRSFLRQDPDIIMLGEMRDSETADIGIKAALTGFTPITRPEP